MSAFIFLGIIRQISALELNYLNKESIELKEQHLPDSYSGSADLLLTGGKATFSLLENKHIDDNSIFYLKYFSTTQFSLILNGLEYEVPASDSMLYVTIPLDNNSSVRSFSLVIENNKGVIKQLDECGILKTEDFFRLYKDEDFISYENNQLSIYTDPLQNDDNISLIFESDFTSQSDNINLIFEGSTEYSMKTRKGSNQFWFYGSSLDSPSGNITISADDTSLSQVIFNNNIDDWEAIPSDLEEIINWDQSLWRQEDFELFNWDLFPGMLILDTVSYDVQALFFKRLAFYTEKKGFVGRFLSDEELQPLHGWNAHDYRAHDLAIFFNEAQKAGVILNEYELLLKKILIDNGVLKRAGERVRPVKGGILSFSRNSSERLRWLFLTHECCHGIFFSSDDFVQKVTAIWQDLAEEEREFWKTFLDMYGYNIADEYLLVNEFQAYLMQQRTEVADSYFKSKIWWISARRPYLDETMDTLLSEYGDTFTKSAENVENAAFSLTGIKAGDLVLKRKK